MPITGFTPTTHSGSKCVVISTKLILHEECQCIYIASSDKRDQGWFLQGGKWWLKLVASEVFVAEVVEDSTFANDVLR